MQQREDNTVFDLEEMSENLPDKSNFVNEVMPEPFCRCWDEYAPDPGNPNCGCGEALDIVKWRWEIPSEAPRWVELNHDRKQVVFHPFYSSGTAVVKGNAPFNHNVHYYWEVKMLTQPYGTDIMVGLGTKEVPDAARDYTTFLGGNPASYGLSYTGAICHNSVVKDDCPGFCKGTIIGVMVDMFLGTLEFYLNREPQGISFTDLRRHQTLYPMLCSTAAQSSMRLTYASSWTSSLLINAAKILAASVSVQKFLAIVPPGLAQIIKLDFWIALRSAGKLLEKQRHNVASSGRPIRERIKDRRW